MDVWPDLPTAPRRIVSLVPSLTETVCDFGRRAALIGRTDYCIHPTDLADVPTVGGTKNPDLQRILDLKPDLVLANHEENRQSDLEALHAAGLPVAVSCPLTVTECLDMLWRMAVLLHVPEMAQRVDQIERAYEWQVRAAEAAPRLSVFCPIWREPQSLAPASWWMTIERRTYTHDVLSTLGLENVFADRPRRYPLAADLGQAPAEDAGTRDTRYPRVASTEVTARDPEVVLLPTEPYPFGEADREGVRMQFAGMAAVRQNRVCVVDGTLLTWAGTRIAKTLSRLPALVADLRGAA